jgi:hypothetical protein
VYAGADESMRVVGSESDPVMGHRIFLKEIRQLERRQDLRRLVQVVCLVLHSKIG